MGRFAKSCFNPRSQRMRNAAEPKTQWWCSEVFVRTQIILTLSRIFDIQGTDRSVGKRETVGQANSPHHLIKKGTLMRLLISCLITGLSVISGIAATLGSNPPWYPSAIAFEHHDMGRTKLFPRENFNGSFQ